MKTLKYLLISLLLLLGMTPVSALEVTDNLNEFKITNQFIVPEGATIPNITFKYEITPLGDAPQATIADISFDQNDQKTLTNGKYILLKESNIQFGTFTKAGEYIYTLQQVKENKEGIDYDTNNYELHVYVINKDDGTLEITAITAFIGEEKQSNLTFTNTYSKEGKLVIEKQVEGDLADHTRDFNFTIEFFDGTYTGKIGEESITFNQNEKVTFTLHHKEQLIFENIPVGTHYQVIETGENNGYTPHVQLTENGHVFDEVVGQTGVDLTANIKNQNNYVGENENYVLFVNSYNSTPITGLNENNWPYILLLALSTLGLVFFGVRKYVYKNH